MTINIRLAITGTTLLCFTAAYGAEKVVQRYECPICHRVAEYAEDSAHIHHCSGTDDNPHTKVVMIHRGKALKNPS